MISYLDQAFCASKVKKHTCGREFTKEHARSAEKWWGSKAYPVAYGYFCGKPDTKPTPKRAGRGK